MYNPGVADWLPVLQMGGADEEAICAVAGKKPPKTLVGIFSEAEKLVKALYFAEILGSNDSSNPWLNAQPCYNSNKKSWIYENAIYLCSCQTYIHEYYDSQNL